MNQENSSVPVTESLRAAKEGGAQAKPLSEGAVALIRELVLNDNAPEILEVIERTCKEESARLMHIWYEHERAKPPTRPESICDIFRRERERENEIMPRWMWWSFFASHFDYTIRDLREKLEQRDMTRGQIDDIRKQRSIDAKRRELEALERE